jgi:hypothetical protein
MRTCKKCGRSRTISRPRGMCDRCYTAWLKEKAGPCSHCKKAPGWKPEGLCNACYLYRRRTGRLKLLSWPKTCTICHKRPAIGKSGKCKTCHSFGKPGQRCRNTNCQRPLEFIQTSNGYCCACTMYYRRNGKPRPAALAQPASGRFCDCGQPATRTKQVRFLRHGQKGRQYTTDNLNLCNSCWELEQELCK